MDGSWDAYLASPADFAGADDIITNLAKEREPEIKIIKRTPLSLNVPNNVQLQKISILPLRKVFCFASPSPQENSSLTSHIASKILTFKSPLPLGISDNLPWGGYGYLLELHNLFVLQLAKQFHCKASCVEGLLHIQFCRQLVSKQCCVVSCGQNLPHVTADGIFQHFYYHHHHHHYVFPLCILRYQLVNFGLLCNYHAVLIFFITATGELLNVAIQSNEYF